jgi:hypothetical protein
VKPARLLNPAQWPDLGLELVMRLAGPLHRARAPLQPLPTDLARRARIIWPATYKSGSLGKLAEQVKAMLARRVPVETTQLEQPYRGTALVQFVLDGRSYDVAFNVSDYPDLLDKECTRRCLLTFKFQYLEEGYNERSVLPGGYVPSSPMLYDMLPWLRWRHRSAPRRFDVYGRFSLDFAPGPRGEALRRLSEATSFTFSGGAGHIRPSRYLREVARARICIDLPGNGPFCFRLVEYLAIGCCIVAVPHGLRLPGPLVDGVQLRLTNPEASDLVERCDELLAAPARRTAMEQQAAAFFDRYLHRDQLAAYYLAALVDVADGRATAGS